MHAARNLSYGILMVLSCVKLNCEACGHWLRLLILSLCAQTTKSVNSVLQDIKAKHEAAAKQLAAAGQDMSKSQGDMDILKVAQQAKLEEIKKLCK